MWTQVSDNYATWNKLQGTVFKRIQLQVPLDLLNSPSIETKEAFLKLKTVKAMYTCKLIICYKVYKCQTKEKRMDTATKGKILKIP